MDHEDAAPDREAPPGRRLPAGQEGEARDPALQGGRAQAEEAGSHPELRGRLRDLAPREGVSESDRTQETLVIRQPAEALSRLVRGPVFKTGGGSSTGVSAGSIPVRFRRARSARTAAAHGTRQRPAGLRFALRASRSTRLQALSIPSLFD